MSKLLVDEISDADNTGPVTVTDGAVVNRTGAGTIIDLQSGGTTVGSIGTGGGRPYFVANDGSTGGGFKVDSTQFYPVNRTGAVSNGALDLGYSSGRWKNLYLSGGVVFNVAGGTGTSTSGTLDDYEEGTWVPNIQPTTGSITWLSSADTLSYIKVGSAVHIFGRLEVSSVSSPSGITRGSVPFTMATLGEEAERATGVCLISGTTLNCGDFGIYPAAGGAFLEIIRTTSSTIGRDAGAYLGAGDVIDITQTYYAA
jgi:hypothetical protein